MRHNEGNLFIFESPHNTQVAIITESVKQKITGVVFPLVLSFSLKHFVMSFKQKQQLEISVMLETLCINIVECVAV